ncbi:RHS repeat-associated core domain-containing protein, partial [Yersinia aldovae]|uniref:RHS repeat-associated core domain-containing protein n=1 Tax=Yersinia aldovae TaxID=29483 RepID=UPI000B06C6C5
LKDGFRPQVWRYRWDEQDQLSELMTPFGERWRYGYDAFGRRIRKLRLVSNAPAVSTQGDEPTASEKSGQVGYEYLWSGDQLIEEVPIYADGTAAYEQSIHWLYAPGALTPAARYENGKLHYVVADHLGTPRELLNEQGKVVWANRLSTWGRAELWRQAANDEDNVTCNLRFAGQYADAESGLHYNRFRYYDGETGQYLCPDPIGLLGGNNPYAYVPNPLSWVDPLGLAKCPMGEILADADKWSLAKISDRQKGMIKDKLSTVKERSKALNTKIREHFNANESKIISEWEKQTGMSWPKLSSGSRATPHHVIPIKNGGSNEWWNIIPVQHPHTGTIHGTGSALRTHLPYQKDGGRLWNLLGS